jgi:endo-1,4-beta-xylanase
VVSWPGRSDGLYPGIWVDLLGPEYIDIALHATAQADPHALRVLNIHHVEQGTPDNEKTRRNAIALLEQLIVRGAPVQAVGIESHLDVMQPLAGDALVSFLKEVQSLGLKIMITELDVKESRATGTSEDWDRAVAKYYADYLDLVLPMLSANQLIFWSLQDRWENGRRIQGLLESDLSPRSSFGSVESALRKSCT